VSPGEGSGRPRRTPAAEVRLRRLEPADAARLRAWLADPEVRRHFLGAAAAREADGLPVAFGPRPAGPAAHLARVIETADGRPIGWVELRDANWRRRSAELRICLGERAAWGRGLGTEALRQFLALAFGVWGLDSVYLRVATWNLRAVRAYERVGFRREGHLAAGPRVRCGHQDLWLMRADRPGGAAAGSA